MFQNNRRCSGWQPVAAALPCAIFFISFLYFALCFSYFSIPTHLLHTEQRWILCASNSFYPFYSCFHYSLLTRVAHWAATPLFTCAISCLCYIHPSCRLKPDLKSRKSYGGNTGVAGLKRQWGTERGEINLQSLRSSWGTYALWPTRPTSWRHLLTAIGSSASVVGFVLRRHGCACTSWTTVLQCLAI